MRLKNSRNRKALKLIKYTLLYIFFMLTMYGICGSANAQYGIALGLGLNSNMYAGRLSFQVDSQYCLDNDIWPATGYWEGSVNYITQKGNKKNNIGGLSVAYVVHFEKVDKFCRLDLPYAEIGLGGALFNKNHFLERRLGSSGLFEVKLGAGMRFGEFKEFDLSYKFIHFSNAYLRKPNDGINLNFVVFSYLF